MSFLRILGALGAFQETTPPVGAPNPPSNLVLSDNSTCPSCSGSYSVTVSWTNGDTEQTRVYRGGVLVQTLGVGVTQWVDTGGSVGSPNSYVVRHWNGSLESTGISDSVTPDPCADDVTTPTSAGLVVQGTDQIDITPEGGGPDCYVYNIYEAGGALIVQVPAGNTYNHTGLNPGTEYSYDIEAESATGCKSSKLTSQSDFTDIATPSAPTVAADDANTLTLTLPAYPTGADRYRIFYAGGAEIGTVSSPTLEYEDPNTLTPGTGYSYEIQAEDSGGDAGDSAKSSSGSGTTQNGTISSVLASHDQAECPSASINLSWDVGDNDTATLLIERKLPSEGSYSTLASGVAAGTEAYEDTTHDELDGGGTTYYRVSFEGITGGASDDGTVTVDCRPDEPFGSDCSVDGADVDITWNDASSVPAETGFKIYRAPDSGGVPGTWSQIDTVGAGVEVYVDQPGEGFWHYAVSSYNAIGESDKNECLSNPVQMT